MRKKIIFTLLLLSLFGAGISYAYFSAVITVSKNNIKLGTIGLEIVDANGKSLSTDAIWNSLNLTPNEVVKSDLRFKNSGTIKADHVALTIANTISESQTAPGKALTIPVDRVIKLTLLTYDGTNFLDQIKDVNRNSIVDLDDWKNSPALKLPLNDLGVVHTLRVETVADSVLTTDEHQGDSLATQISLTLKQSADAP